MNWEDYFTKMEDWKRLPAYRVEPRIDSLIGYYLPDMASDFIGEKIVGIIPELPIRLGTVKPHLNQVPFADKSYKVDFYLLGESGTHYFARLIDFHWLSKWLIEGHVERESWRRGSPTGRLTNLMEPSIK